MVSMAKKDKTLGEKITGMFKKAPVEKKKEVIGAGTDFLIRKSTFIVKNKRAIEDVYDIE